MLYGLYVFAARRAVGQYGRLVRDIARDVAYSIFKEDSSAQEPERVENNKNGRPCVGQDREPKTRVTEQGEDKEDSFYPDGESDVKSDDASRVRRPSRMASETMRRSSRMRATSAVSIAVSVPAAPIAMPTLAAANAGASFTPSPRLHSDGRPAMKTRLA